MFGDGISIEHEPNRGRHVIRMSTRHLLALEQHLSWDDGYGPLFSVVRAYRASVLKMPPIEGHAAHTGEEVQMHHSRDCSTGTCSLAPLDANWLPHNTRPDHEGGWVEG